MAHLLALYDSVACNLILLTQDSFLQINIFLALTTHLNLGEAEVFICMLIFPMKKISPTAILSNFKYSH